MIDIEFLGATVVNDDILRIINFSYIYIYICDLLYSPYMLLFLLMNKKNMSKLTQRLIKSLIHNLYITSIL